ncbi:MAG: glycoside hydrolase family 3 C-terminal domain-containing protein, partial [Chitinophagales bacterium]
LFRDPRWGRGQETYGEDPFLTASMGVSFVLGLQGNDPHYLKTAAGAKHFAVHSGPEAERHGFNAVVDERDLRETYLYAFNKLVGAGVETVMCAYNRINGEPCCTGQGLLRNILRNQWHFSGQIVTDCGALNDIMDKTFHKPSPEELAAEAIKAGVNLECGSILQKDLSRAIEQKLISAVEIDSALAPTLRTRFKLGLFDMPEIQPYRSFGADSVHNPSHIDLARRVARESMVLLKNNGILPLQKNKYGSIMVVGSNASSLDALVGSYHGINGDLVSFAEGIAKASGPAIAVQYDQGYDNLDTSHFGGIWAASMSDLTIAVIGLTPVLEGEEGDAFLSASGGDKSMKLPEAQIIYLKKLKKATKKPIIVVIAGGSCFDLSPIEPLADAILFAWYPGEQGGNALADILFGKNSPSGHLPISFYRSLDQLPAYKEYAMKGRTYRYFSGPLQYPFGFGLTYTRFKYSWNLMTKQNFSETDTIQFSVNVQNTGDYDAQDLVQAYIQYPPEPGMPIRELRAYKKVWIEKGSSALANLHIPVSELRKWDSSAHDWKIYPGEYHLIIGESARDQSLEKTFTVGPR